MVLEPRLQALCPVGTEPMNLLVPVSALDADPTHQVAQGADPVHRQGVTDLGCQPEISQCRWGRAHGQVSLQGVDGRNLAFHLL